ncbi:sugar kinase [Streptomyces gamaensis]|uniref:Sugar kinase n=1 Tax=Streptomyces gamaensis TaxID=1763542 RepID=A0ABW0YQY4_9ACTN
MDGSRVEASTAAVAADVVCLGESMVTFRPSRPGRLGRLADVSSFDRGIGGAESNVACALARSGHRARWVSRVGADGFGDHLTEAVAAYGVDVSAVTRDAERPTGVYFRTAGERCVSDGPGQTDASPAEVAYYRAGSAASAMSPANVPREVAWSGRILHLTGITAALSTGCLALLRTLTARRPGRPLVSFDANYRPGLWRTSPEGPSVLAELARACDIVFVGEDEAEAAWGVRGPEAIRAALPEPDVLVVKQGARGATAYVRPGAGDSGSAGAGGAAPGSGMRAAPVGGTAADAAAGAVAPGHPRGPGTGGVPDGRTPVPGGDVRPGESGSGVDAGLVGGPAADALARAGAPGGDVRPRRPGTGPGAGPVGGSGAGASLRVPARDVVTFVPALRVDVVAPVGAGDAFAAGFLAGTLRGLPVGVCLRWGHLFAAAVLAVPGDLAEPPAPALVERLAALDDDAWGRLRPVAQDTPAEETAP